MLKKSCWLLAVGGLILVCIVGFQLGNQRQSDFSGYYTAAKIVATTDSVSNMYDDPWFVGRMLGYGIPESTFIMYVNPPAVAYVMTPFAMLTPREAKLVWNAFSALLLVVAFFLLRSLFDFPIDSVESAIVVMLLSGLPLLRNLELGQIYVMMLVLVILMLRSYARDKPVLAGIALASLLMLKYFGWMFLLLFVVERNWKALGWTAAFLCLGTLIVGALAGMDTYKAHFEVLFAAARRGDFGITGLPCVPALFGALFVFHPRWNTNVVADLPWLASVLTILSLAALLTLTFRRIGASHMLRRASAILVLSVLFTPLAAVHHFMLLVVPAVCLLMQYRSVIHESGAAAGSSHSPGFRKSAASGAFYLEPSKLRPLAGLGLVLVLVFGWHPSIPMSALDGWAKLLAFPRLFAALSLWLMLIGTRQDRPTVRANA